MTRGIRLRFVLFAAASLSACSLETAPAGGPSGGARQPAVVCSTGGAVPNAFRPRGAARVHGDGIVGMRRSFRDDRGRRLHLTSGITGEFGEALPIAGTVGTPGAIGYLYGLDGSSTWILTWDPGPPCGRRTATGIGFRRGEFVALLRRAGLIVPR